MSSDHRRGQVDDTSELVIDEQTVTEDTLGGLPRSNYLTGDFSADIQSMLPVEIGRVMDKFPYTKRGRE